MHPLPFLAALILVAAFNVRAADPTPAPNTLSATEKAEGWKLLFDGRTSAGWRGFKATGFPAFGWSIEDGCIRHLFKGKGGDVITTEKYNDYEFAFEWRIDAGGNSGVKYFITEDRESAIGHEYQLLGEKDAAELRANLLHATASFYAVAPVSADAPLRPPGSWNQSRIIVRGKAVEHWLNGARVCQYELGSPEITAGIAKSKFKGVEGFGTKFPHHLLLQDHGGDTWFRNLKLRPLP